MADSWDAWGKHVLAAIIEMRQDIERLEARFNQLVLYFLATAVGGVVTLAGYIVTQR